MGRVKELLLTLKACPICDHLHCGCPEEDRDLITRMQIVRKSAWQMVSKDLKQQQRLDALWLELQQMAERVAHA